MFYGKDKFQYKGYIFSKEMHCETCSLEIARKTNSTAVLSVENNCPHPKTIRLFLYSSDKPNNKIRQATNEEINLAEDEYQL